MENLVSQCPELGLKKTVSTRTVHKADLTMDAYKNNRVGDVIKLETWHDADGRRWSRADLMLYIQLNSLDVIIPQPKHEMALV